MKKLIVVLGKSSSGKSTLARLISKNMNAKTLVASTSRDKREAETDGVDYHFKSEEEFKRAIDNDELIEYNVFNGWYYGLEKKELTKHINNLRVVVLNPSGYKKLMEYVSVKEVVVLYVECGDKLRLSRSLNRGDKPTEICRRFLADERDFRGIKELVYTNNGYIINSDNRSSFETFSIARKIIRNK